MKNQMLHDDKNYKAYLQSDKISLFGGELSSRPKFYFYPFQKL